MTAPDAEPNVPPEQDVSPVPARDESPGIDWDAIRAEVTDPIVGPGRKPDYKASQTKRSGRVRELLGKPAGDKATDAPKRKTAAPKKTVPNRKGQFVEPLTSLYTTIGLAMMPFDSVCGNSVVQSATRCAETLDELAHKNEAVRRALWALVNTSALGAVIAAHMPILLAIILHHVPSAQRVMGNMGASMAEDIAKKMAEETARTVDGEASE